jgi:hypothetical protein
MHIIPASHEGKQVDVFMALPEQHPPLQGCWPSHAVAH